ncbi:uncharacterized protein RSE6_03050 [Rhynchosporium secalis]|uniref:Uncharacterized protein n=1 Tax=Rhynchosporium secalis TaxID=38038 RepID=A0A1E1M1S8_RHYSE|nr:uncharacterized protein RSE6_03050 [Rhynchosporium secalis]
MTHSQRTTLEPGSRTEPHPPTNPNRQCQSMPTPFSMPMQARVKIQEAATISSDIDIEVTLSTFQPLKLQPGSPAGQGQPPKLLQGPASRLRHDGGWLDNTWPQNATTFRRLPPERGVQPSPSVSISFSSSTIQTAPAESHPTFRYDRNSQPLPKKTQLRTLSAPRDTARYPSSYRSRRFPALLISCSSW